MLTALRTFGLLRGILFGLLAVSIQLSIFQGQIAHGMAVREVTAIRHAILEEQPSKETHVHGDGEVTEHVRGHSHSHNPTDHSHDTPMNVALVWSHLPAATQQWLLTQDAKMRNLGPGRLERPPANLPFA
jgi:hypothetical protein